MEILLIKRIPIVHGVFEDKEIAKRYNKETKKWIGLVAKSFISVIKKWGVNKGKVLDIGTGTGLLAIEIVKVYPNVEVIGLDLSDVVLEVARENVEKSEARLRVSFEKGDAEDIPFEDNTFNLIISSNTLHLIKNPIKMFNEIQRVLKPDGKFIISDFRRSLLGIVSKHFRASYSPKEVKELLTKSKLQNWKVKDYFFWLSVLSKN